MELLMIEDIDVGELDELEDADADPDQQADLSSKQLQAIEAKKITRNYGKILRQIMVDHDINNIKLAALAQVPEPYISRLRNGVLSQRNYIKIIRALPQAARIDYIFKVFDLDEHSLDQFLIERHNQRK